jgi:hypothetical protein
MNDNRFYVYLHRRKDNDIVFYVGKGQGSRAIQATHRSKSWKLIEQESGGYYIEYYKTNLLEHDALILEGDLLQNPPHDWSLVNCQKYAPVIELNKTELLEYFEYDESSPSALKWIKSNSNRACIGKPAGYLSTGLNGHQEWQVRFKGKLLKAHRIVMCLKNGPFDSNLVINHIDNNSTNNKITNLELCTKAENNRRQSCHTGKKLKSNNKSGRTGIYEYTIGEYHYVCVDIKLNSKRFNKNFSYNKYGKDVAWQLANQYYDQLNKDK